MSFEWNISNSEPGCCLQLKGELTRSTLLPLWQQRAALFAENAFLSPESCLYIELNHLQTVDSAGFVLICEILHHYSQYTTVKLRAVPHLVRDFAELYDLEQWLTPFIQ
ncbi:phospholipid transport system transporter-binding protein [Pasteurella testudinis DSM 23072]|uniref:Phospholipid transport system transporter-binding protein n=1 Tax=Pasteurella testudinis DSM 23072 TaxID=1122938 RepID=A0A1W1V4L5_9PAST|nr:STAS domain-containing protein [Pasteurella testudinis]SMB88317.1 phospholipid transport system transporter-binding protein [Pasteurella testudinis DSM 23072]SUB51130.1 sulfate transporter/antisigma-factor antagonist STAS family protein [Pasteurella testudinis]